MSGDVRHRSAVTGRLVTAAFAAANPDTTVEEAADEPTRDTVRAWAVENWALTGSSGPVAELLDALDPGWRGALP